MANVAKIGFDYFPMDVTIFSDIKTRKLIKYQGGKAITVYTYLLCNIYTNGYYIVWDDELPFIISEATGFDEAYISEVFKCCLNIGIFSRQLFESNKVISSFGIQKRFQKICKDAKRKVGISEFKLIDSEGMAISPEEMGNDSESIGNSTGKKTQRKEQERKEKKSTGLTGDESPPQTSFKNLSEKEFTDSLKPFLEDYGKDCLNAFFRYWAEKSPSGKMKFQLQKTWETGKRLVTWRNNNEQWGKNVKSDNGNNDNTAARLTEAKAREILG